MVILNESESQWCVIWDVDCIPVGQFPFLQIAVGKGDLGRVSGLIVDHLYDFFRKQVSFVCFFKWLVQGGTPF